MAHNVKVFTLSTCSHCKATKQFLRNNGIDFEFKDIDLLQGSEKENTLQEVVKYNPQRSFPTIIIGNKTIVGFKEADIRKALGI
jgi:glutaredoxin-like protein NrdH